MAFFQGLLLILILANAAFADVKEEIAKCASIADKDRRLECFDAVADTLGNDKALIRPATAYGKWFVSTKQSMIDDSTNVYLSLEAEDDIDTGYGTTRPILHLRCSENKTSLFIVWNLYLGENSIEVLTRVDQQKAKSSYWSISTDNKAIFAPGRDTKYAKILARHKTLIVQLTPSGRSPLRATFDVTGLAEAMRPLQEACHWK